MNMLAFSLPMPPSTNSLFATDFRTKRRFMSKEYSAWRTEAVGLINLAWQQNGHPSFLRHMSLTIHVGLNYAGDIANRIKAVEDAICEAIPDFPNDRYFDVVTIERVPGLNGARVLVGQLAPPSARSIGEILDPMMAGLVGAVEKAA